MSHFPCIGGIVRQQGKEVELVVSNIKDEKLLRLLKRNSRAGMNQLIESYGALAACIVRSRISSVCNEYDVEECVAEVFAELYEQRGRIDLSRGSLKGYISLIARRRAIDKFNAAVKNINRTAELDESCNDIVYDEDSTPEGAAMQREMRRVLLQEVERLGIPDSEILFRRYFLEQPLNEIAEALGMNRPAVSKRIERALAKLRIIMEEYI